ncbi:MurR/RpiR family transcriptional regulator [Sedimentimonas flavescens]|uniref:MurR/RpiR family transcriptional regulator n=1 Tax=Sedimentimonas flavescens TaxID=2851012 RepID=UPI001C4A35C8|nr:MurR/RpiR family transcriptional regulator [Sedimentimonas flavescens]MBW0157581.1 MurR/RpiR family transcriptional regulator [Sedimentimonas flavescens]
MMSEEKLQSALRDLAQTAPPKLGAFALWLLEHWNDIAFNSIRGLAQKAGVDANLVTRTSRELGYEGYDALRADVQRLLQRGGATYGGRARALRNLPDADIFTQVLSASGDNLQRLSSPTLLETANDCIAPLLEARHVYSVGVRSCYSIAHYLSYVGGLTFDNFVPAPAAPGAILDQVSQSTPEDVVVAITYAHYSAEVVRACQIARECGARVLALTDAQTSPIALGAWKVICLPMSGPQLMPSLNSAFLTVELILAAMAARSDGAADRVARFEERIARFGGYMAQ